MGRREVKFDFIERGKLHLNKLTRPAVLQMYSLAIVSLDLNMKMMKTISEVTEVTD